MSGTTVLKGFKEVVEGQFTAETGYIYFVHKTTEKRYILLNGKKYGENILRFIDSGSTTGGGVTIEEVIAAIDDAMATETARTETTYLKEHQSLDDYATKEYVNDAISGISTSAETQALIDAAMAEETARTETTYLKEHQSLTDYYTSAQTDNAISEAVEDLTEIIDKDGEVVAQAFALETARTETTYFKKEEIADYYTSAQTDNAIADAMAAETARTETTYLKEHQSLADYYTSAQTDSAITSSIATAMTNVVTSTTITTIVCCTQQEYDNMQTHPSDTLYVINNN